MTSGTRTRVWDLLLADVKLGCVDAEARYAIVDAWAAYIAELEARIEVLEEDLQMARAYADSEWQHGQLERAEQERIAEEVLHNLRGNVDDS